MGHLRAANIHDIQHFTRKGVSARYRTNVYFKKILNWVFFRYYFGVIFLCQPERDRYFLPRKVFRIPSMEWLIIVYLVIYLLGACVINLNIIFYYANPEDSKYNHGLVAKAVSLIALEFSWLTLSITPTDAYNTRNNAGLNTAVFWHLVLTLNLCLILFPIPFAMSYYEADTDTRVTRSPRWYRAFKPSLFVLFFGAVVTVILYFALRSTQYLVCPPSTVSGENVFSIAASNGTKPECQWTATRTPFFAFSGIIFAFLGWVLVFLYLGVGFIMVPAGLILDFVTRPKPMSQDEYR